MVSSVEMGIPQDQRSALVTAFVPISSPFCGISKKGSLIESGKPTSKPSIKTDTMCTHDMQATRFDNVGTLDLNFNNEGRLVFSNLDEVTLDLNC